MATTMLCIYWICEKQLQDKMVGKDWGILLACISCDTVWSTRILGLW